VKTQDSFKGRIRLKSSQCWISFYNCSFQVEQLLFQAAATGSNISILLVPRHLFGAAFRASDFLSSCSFERVLNRVAASNFCSFDRMLFCIRAEESRTEPIALAFE
jgi:hypothetical protein